MTGKVLILDFFHKYFKTLDLSLKKALGKVECFNKMQKVRHWLQTG